MKKLVGLGAVLVFGALVWALVAWFRLGPSELRNN